MPERKDYYLEHPPLKPKAEIADYVEQNGILVPRRFDSKQEAYEHILTGGEIKMRSEHPQEYAGVSGLAESHTINQSTLRKGRERGGQMEWEKWEKSHDHRFYWTLFDQLCGQMGSMSEDEFIDSFKRLESIGIKLYCDHFGIDLQDFVKEMSYSYWEKVPGYNRSIIADSALPERYHIFTSNKERCGHNYLITDNDEIILNTPHPLTDELMASRNEVIRFYEQIRNLDRFDPDHCPIVEFQTDPQGTNYFLQYHRTRQMEPACFALDREAEPDEFVAEYVRGATPSEGIDVNVTVYYPQGYPLQDQEDGSLDLHHDDIYADIMSRRRKVNVFDESLSRLADQISDSHLPKSRLFKPGLAVAISRNRLSKTFIYSMYDKAQKTQAPSTLPMRIVSDGRKAYVKFLEDIR